MPDAELRALARAVDAKDAVTSEHSLRVAQLAQVLAMCVGWTAPNQHQMYEAGIVHDVGKLGIDTEILQKPGKLTASEFEVIKTHPEAGVAMLRSGDYEDVDGLRWIAEHHERPDGTGYPRGSHQCALSEGGMVLALADAFDVMCSARPYKTARRAIAGLNEATRLCGQQFAHPAVRALEHAYELGELARYDGHT